MLARPIQPAPTSVAAFAGGAPGVPSSSPFQSPAWLHMKSNSAPAAPWDSPFVISLQTAAPGHTSFGPGFQTSHKGPYALDKASSFNLLCIPPLSPKPA